MLELVPGWGSSRHCTLRRDGHDVAWWGRRFEVRTDDQPIGSISPHQLFTRRAVIALPDDLMLPVNVFIAALVVLLWNRDSSGAAGGASATG